MSINQLILRNLKKNLKNYYLYVFALIFSVALYFAFVTLQYDPALDETKGSVKGGASIRAASVVLVAIVSIFLLYANNIFIKRRSKEIGLFQLIGLTKNKIFRLLTAENVILYFGSLAIGIGIGFAFSKLVMMVLFHITGVDIEAKLHFSEVALIQTVIVFSMIYLLIMLMNVLFIKKQSILSLFRVLSSTEGRVKKVSILEMILGAVGISSIIVGYYVSSKLFSGDYTTMPQLFGAMIFILATVIIGTYLFYKGSVSFIFNIIRKQKNGYVNIREVLSLTSIMFRMKSSALLLTIITTVSALAIGLLSLSYISYYSAEKTAKNNVPSDFSFVTEEAAEQFKSKLESNGIGFTEDVMDVIQLEINVKQLLKGNTDVIMQDPTAMTFPAISDAEVEGIDVSPEETLFTGFNDLLQKFMPMKDSGEIELKGLTTVIPQNYLGLKDGYPVSWYYTNGGVPVAIIDEAHFKTLKHDLNPEIQKASHYYVGIDIKDESKIEMANDFFIELGFAESNDHDSQLLLSSNQKQTMGLMMFIVGFLGLAFLITSGCILYFKQMDESEEEKPSYTILRKLGFTPMDLLKGVQRKQLFSFGIPLVIGLVHSYFAVQSGWFLFGAEVWTPMIIVMVIYTGLYSIFGLLSVLYYKKVIQDAL